jgi:hypothetical protein
MVEDPAGQPLEDPPEKGELDLLTIGLVVFFVALIGVVAVMLALTVL